MNLLHYCSFVHNCWNLLASWGRRGEGILLYALISFIDFYIFPLLLLFLFFFYYFFFFFPILSSFDCLFLCVFLSPNCSLITPFIFSPCIYDYQVYFLFIYEFLIIFKMKIYCLVNNLFPLVLIFPLNIILSYAFEST